MSHTTPSFVFAAVALAVGFGLATSAPIRTASTANASPQPNTPGPSSTAAPEATVVAVRQGQPFTLAMGETAAVNDALQVRFRSVIADSRCPVDVQCVWEGNGQIEIEITADGEAAATLRLNTNPGFATDATYLTYTVKLVDLQPYPTMVSDATEPYVATLSVDVVTAQPSNQPRASAAAAVSDVP